MDRYFKIILICSFLCACSTIQTNKLDKGHPYAGTQNAITTAPCNIVLSGTVLFIYVPFIIADIPLSFVADTVYLPWTLTQESKKDRSEVTYTVGEYCDEITDGMKMTAKDSGVNQEGIKNVSAKPLEIFIKLNITHNQNISKSKDLVNSMKTLETMIIDELRALKFQVNSELTLDVSIENFRYVSKFGRDVLASLIGAAKIKIKVTELSGQNNIRKATFEANSTFSEGGKGATTEMQLLEMAKKVAQFVYASDKTFSKN